MVKKAGLYLNLKAVIFVLLGYMIKYSPHVGLICIPRYEALGCVYTGRAFLP